MLTIRRRSDYIIGFVTPAIGPNKSRKLTRLIAPAHNSRGKVWMKNNINRPMASQTMAVCKAMHVFLFKLCRVGVYIVCRRDKPCKFPGFVWTDCWGNKSYYVITSPANSPFSRLAPRGQTLVRLGIKVGYGGMNERYAMNKNYSITTQWSMLSYSNVTVAFTGTRDPVTADTKFSWLPFPKPQSQHF